MTRKETLHHFNLACGVLPEDEADGPVIAEETPAPFIAHPLERRIDLLPAGFGDMIAENDASSCTPFTDGASPNNPSGGGPPVYVPPFTGGFTSPGGGTPGTADDCTSRQPRRPPGHSRRAGASHLRLDADWNGRSGRRLPDRFKA